MMRDVNAHQFDDPSQHWSPLLEGIHGRRRDAIVKALRRSVESGYPATPEGVRILVAYAQGQISARQFVSRTLESLGFRPAAYATATTARRPEPSRQSSHPDPWTDARRAQRPSLPLSSDLLDFNESRSKRARYAEPFSDTRSRQPNRNEAVRAFVSGQIPVEEFLRLQRTRTS